MMKLQFLTLRAHLQHPFFYLAIANNNQAEKDLQVVKAAENIPVTWHTCSRKKDMGASGSHAHALNEAMALVLRNGLLTPSHFLMTLDSDMFLTSEMDLRHELHGAQIATVVQRRLAKKSFEIVEYVWPNFAIFFFGMYGVADASSLFRQIDFGACSKYRNTVTGLDSGGCTAAFLDRNKGRVNVSRFIIDKCTVSQPKDVYTCHFLHEKSKQEQPARCTHSYTLENRLVSSRVKICNSTRKQPGHLCAFGKVYHIGSAGSNWRKCPEHILARTREEFMSFISHVLSKAKLKSSV